MVRAPYARLASMMRPRFAVWGAWSVSLSRHMRDLHFKKTQIGHVFGTTVPGSLLSPVIAGWIAVQWFPVFYLRYCDLVRRDTPSLLPSRRPPRGPWPASS